MDKIFTDEGYVSIENGKMRIENFTYNYVLTDHLGHTRSVVSSSGEVLQEHAYYPYGMEIGHLSKQIGSGTNYNYLYTQKEVLDYGGLTFTDHHARLWDYETGRWNGIDPALQMHSPYAGMGMNPMAYIDPDGEFFIAGTSLLVTIANAAITGVIAGTVSSALSYSLEAAAFETWDWGAFGKSVGVGAGMGALSGAIAGGVGFMGKAGGFLEKGLGMGELGVGVTTTGLHMTTQGGLSAAFGGDFWSSALSAGMGHAVGLGMKNAGMGNLGQVAASSFLGGFTSKLSGGSFLEGAATALIVHMCNQKMTEWNAQLNARKILETQSVDYLIKRFNLQSPEKLFHANISQEQILKSYKILLLSQINVHIDWSTQEGFSGTKLKGTVTGFSRKYKKQVSITLGDIKDAYDAVGFVKDVASGSPGIMNKANLLLKVFKAHPANENAVPISPKQQLERYIQHDLDIIFGD